MLRERCQPGFRLMQITNTTIARESGLRRYSKFRYNPVPFADPAKCVRGVCPDFAWLAPGDIRTDSCLVTLPIMHATAPAGPPYRPAASARLGVCMAGEGHAKQRDERT